jgi:hypothetical protein
MPSAPSTRPCVFVARFSHRACARFGFDAPARPLPLPVTISSSEFSESAMLPDVACGMLLVYSVMRALRACGRSEQILGYHGVVRGGTADAALLGRCVRPLFSGSLGCLPTPKNGMRSGLYDVTCTRRLAESGVQPSWSGLRGGLGPKEGVSRGNRQTLRSTTRNNPFGATYPKTAHHSPALTTTSSRPAPRA